MPDIHDLWLYAHNIIRSSRWMVNEGLKPLNLGSAEGNVLLHLLTRDCPLRQEDLVAQLDVSKPAISRALDSLEKKGFVVREKDPSDRRASRVMLTTKARAIGPRVEEIYNRVYDVAARVASEEEIHNFIDLFGRVSASFSKTLVQKRNGGGKGRC